ncbi:MAG: FkbM family methyltransferase, partial [Betaproteobacteria bacterium]
SYRLTRLGSGYGGWTFVDDTNLKNSVIVSCGLGEDASFDIEIASTYGAKVIIVDPTPRAIQHYKAMALRVGEKRQQPYSNTGAQPVDAYDLSNISAAQLRLCEKALWNKNTQLQFFAPSNPSHVSHSIVNFQHDYSTETAHIDVEAITIDKLFTTYDIQDLQLIKLDIEGAEVEVLKDMIAKRIYPKQVLVEYDELSVPSKKSKQRIESAHHALTNSGYSLINCEHTNFTYIRHSI